MSAPRISVTATRAALADDEEVAFLDVREFGQYGEGHPFFAVSLPFSRLEADAPRLVPRPGVRVIVMDDGNGIADRCAEILAAMGYTDLHVMEGGAPGWAAAGHTLFKGVNLPSKTFGELVEHHFGTPSVSADELRKMQQNAGSITVLDGRSPREFTKMSIPGARSCPNAELGYRMAQMAPPGAPIVVNCAGRTRSIIGAETLRLAGWDGPVHALRNGTQGWRLAGHDLDHGEDAGDLPAVPPEGIAAARAQAARLIERHALPVVDAATLKRWSGDTVRTLFCFDVRSDAEHAAGHPTGFAHAPGGQLVQATDEALAVRGARIVLACDTGLRAATTAIWLRGMGLNAHVLTNGTFAARPVARTHPAGSITALDIPARLAAGARLLDASKGMEYRAGHITGAVWANRAHLHLSPPAPGRDIIVTGPDAALVEGVRAELEAQGHRVDTAICGSSEWQAAGLDMVQTPGEPSEMACIDHLFFVHDRHEGNLDAARRYLEWETGLLAQLDESERAALRPLVPR